MLEIPKNDGELLKEIESLKKRIAELEKSNVEFIHRASHDMRTPLAIIKEGISLVIDGAAGEVAEEQAKILIMARNNVDRLVDTIGKLAQPRGGKNG
jgi:two-component system sensor histidine kinase GlrK